MIQRTYHGGIRHCDQNDMVRVSSDTVAVTITDSSRQDKATRRRKGSFAYCVNACCSKADSIDFLMLLQSATWSWEGE